MLSPGHFSTTARGPRHFQLYLNGPLHVIDDFGVASRITEITDAIWLSGVGVPQDSAKALELLTKACAADDPGGCNSLGAIYAEGKGVPKDAQKAGTFFEKACKAGHAGGCANQGSLLVKAGDKARGVELLQKGCKAGDAGGCSALKSLGILR